MSKHRETLGRISRELADFAEDQSVSVGRLQTLVNRAIDEAEEIDAVLEARNRRDREAQRAA